MDTGALWIRQEICDPFVDFHLKRELFIATWPVEGEFLGTLFFFWGWGGKLKSLGMMILSPYFVFVRDKCFS